MKRISIILAGAIGLFLLALALPAFAEDQGKEITISGEAKCAKCALHQADKCQTVIQAEKNGKTVSYYLVKNEVSDKFHKNVCSETLKAKATGTCKKVDDKLQLTATKIDLVK